MRTREAAEILEHVDGALRALSAIDGSLLDPKAIYVLRAELRQARHRLWIISVRPKPRRRFFGFKGYPDFNTKQERAVG